MKKLDLFGMVYPEDIWGDGGIITANQVTNFLNTLDSSEEFTVYINSPGGSVFEGLAIYNLLSEYQSRMYIKVIGEASSIASVITCAGAKDRTFIAETALMLIHNPWTFAIVDEDYLVKLEKNLSTIKNSILLAYQRKTGKPAGELSALMSEDVYRSSKESVSIGLADKIYIPSEEEATLKNQSDKIVNQQLKKYMMMNSKISNNKEFGMDLTEDLSKVGKLENQVTNLDSQINALKTVETANLKKISDFEAKVLQLTTDNDKLAAENKSHLASLENSKQGLFRQEETAFVTGLVNNLQLEPVEKDTQVEILLNYRNNPDAKYVDGKSMYDHLRTHLAAKKPNEALRTPLPNNNTEGNNQACAFVYDAKYHNTDEGREKLDIEIKRCMAANNTTYSVEYSRIAGGN